MISTLLQNVLEENRTLFFSVYLSQCRGIIPEKKNKFSIFPRFRKIRRVNIGGFFTVKLCEFNNYETEWRKPQKRRHTQRHKTNKNLKEIWKTQIWKLKNYTWFYRNISGFYPNKNFSKILQFFTFCFLPNKFEGKIVEKEAKKS